MEIFYATRDGQSRKIAHRIAAGLGGHGIETLPKDLAAAQPSQEKLEAEDLAVVVTAIRYGKILPEALELLGAYEKLQKKPKLVFLVVNLTSRKPGKETPEGSVYIRRAIAKYKLEPAYARAIPGVLDYKRYTWRDRQLIRFIMYLTGGPTDPATCVEYTPWDVVDDIAVKIVGIHETLDGSKTLLNGAGHGEYAPATASGAGHLHADE
jgi:menaquinone-dependent protoporphyrinogen oxidase